MVFRVGKHELVEVVDHAPQMIGMGMGEHDVRDVSGIDAGLAEVVQQFSRRGHEIGTRSGIERDQPVAALQEGDVAVGHERVGRQAVGGQQRLQFVHRRSGTDKGQGQDQVSVGNDRDLVFARLNGCGGICTARGGGERKRSKTAAAERQRLASGQLESVANRLIS